MPKAAVRPAVPADLVELGRIVSAYGIRGWIKVQPHSAQAEVLLAASSWWLHRPAPDAMHGQASAPDEAGPAAWRDARHHAVLTSRPQGATVVASLEGVSDRDAAHALRGLCVYVSRQAFPPTDEDEYYWVDLIGCMLFGDQGGQTVLIGRVADVSDNGAHAVLKVHRLSGSGQDDAVAVCDAKGRPVEVLVPFVDAHVRSVDLAGRRIDTDWPADF